MTDADATQRTAGCAGCGSAAAVIAADQRDQGRDRRGVPRRARSVPSRASSAWCSTYNTGAAFSFLAGADGWQRWFFAGDRRRRERCSSSGCCGAAAARMLLCRPRADPRRRARQSLGPPRARQGRRLPAVPLRRLVVPAFNVADSAITVGAALLILDSFRAAPRDDAGRGRERTPDGRPARQSARLLRRRRPRDRDRRAGARAVRRADLRAPRGRPQQVRRRRPARPRARCSSRSSTRCPPGSTVVFSAHGVSKAVRAEADARGLARVRRDLPAGHQGPRRGRARCASRAARS